MTTAADSMSLTDKFVSFLNHVFTDLSGHPSQGNVTFCRCLSPSIVESLAVNQKFNPEGWIVRAVIDEIDTDRRFITSDQAVEIREDKGKAVLLLIDVLRAGAGMDGIYSASRELTEEMIFQQTKLLTRKEIGGELFNKAELAIKQARYIGERKSLSKWQQVQFLASLCAAPDEFGRSISLLGLWPIQGEGDSIKESDLQISTRIVDRLFLGSGNARTPAERVKSLLLKNETPEQEVGLQKVVREAGSRPLTDVIDLVVDNESLWLGEIQPEFLSQQLRKVTIKSWRSKQGKISKWSGMVDGTPPQFILSNDKLSKLEVRFETEPEQLPKGSVEYKVSVVSGEDELAYRDISHAVRKGSQYQSVKITTEDFEGIAEDSQFEARVVVSVIGSSDEEIEDESEEFLIRYGETINETTSNTTKYERCMIEGAVNISDGEQFDTDVTNDDCYEIDRSKNFVAFRATASKKSFKVARPPLIDVIEQMQAEQSTLGRWSVQVRGDGKRVSNPVFHPFDSMGVPESDWDKAIKVSASLQSELAVRGGFWGSVYSGNFKKADTYINAWLPVLEQGNPQVALTDTIEVQSLSGQTIGLIVLPSHPLRIAWHVAYDQLMRYLRFDIGLAPTRVREAVTNLQAAHFPSILPGLIEGQNFIYADTLSFFATAMVSDQDPEPKSAVAMLMRSLGLNEHDPDVSSMGVQVSSSLAREVSRYIQFHKLGESSGGAVLLHALRPGDGCTVARALGTVLKTAVTDEDAASPVRFNLEMFPAQENSDITGSFLVDLVERARTGASGISEGDRWMLESQSNSGGVTLPRLRWAKKDTKVPASPAHMAIAFDSFDTDVHFVSRDSLPETAPLHVFGLVANIQRRFKFQPSAEWLSWLPPDSTGEKHPAGRSMSDRITKLNKAIMGCVARFAGLDNNVWPVLRTQLSVEQLEMLRTIHKLSDWVITVDRNTGVEFFDAPHDEPSIYETYVIDCVPERDDLGSLQMITSTTRTDEIRELLDEMLERMSLSASRKNCEFLVHHLKALSGRLAMRLTSLGSTSSELVALSLVHSHCENATDDSLSWISLRNGFLVPVDDIPDLAPKEKRNSPSSPSDAAPKVRSDLIYISLPARGGLSFTFIEVKYRRNLRAARSLDLIRQIEEQTQIHRDTWMNWYFDGNTAEPLQAIRRSRLVRALRFYLEKAHRHYLNTSQYERFRSQLDRMMMDGANYKFTEPAIPSRGYIFCPEFVSANPETISESGSPTKIVLFGATTMPDLAVGVERTPAPPAPEALEPGKDALTNLSTPDESNPDLNSDAKKAGNENETTQFSVQPNDGKKLENDSDKIRTENQPSEPASVRLGIEKSSDDPVFWSVSSSANPHLMIVGFPGMGKTEAVMNICQQLMQQDITPIVFSYHPDIDERLMEKLENVQLLDHQQLGFNPMHLDSVTRTAHVDSAGMLRDVFSAMFPDLGDIQLEALRSAIRESYVRHGWGGDNESPTIPDFREFYSILKREPKPEKNLLARLDELDDYHIFSNSGEVRSLLESKNPLVLQIHATQNELVQRAVAMLALFNVYKEMFRRGVQDRITHAVVFDEAHRASKMKLLPKLAAECRKFGISLILASQSAKDFDPALYSNVASYLLLRMTDQDANILSKNITTSDQAKRVSDRMKQLEKYHALFFREGFRHPTHVQLDPPS
ncbi:ATP-binding protein [Gimesia sp.]|uniref:ATP-binding protein n=1 Tax=Gimesia sp. TaxID=2024833 RepID=UPI003A95A085